MSGVTNQLLNTWSWNVHPDLKNCPRMLFLFALMILSCHKDNERRLMDKIILHFIKITCFWIQSIFSWCQPQHIKLDKEFTICVLITEHFFHNIFSSDTPSSFQPLLLVSILWCMIVWTLKYWEKESTSGGKLMATLQ